MPFKIRKHLLLTACISAIPTGVFAADAKVTPEAEASDGGSSIAEVVVVARRREESQQTVPVAVTSISADAIAAKGNFDPLDLAKLAPGLVVQSVNADKTNYFYSIRGQSFTTGTLYSAVLPYFSEVPFTRMSPGQFFDLDGVEVLRGPQGTLFGRVTNGGAVLLQPTKPSNTFGGYVSQFLGNFDLHTTAAAVNVPLIDGKLAVRAAMELGRQDGYVTNIVNNVKLNDTNYDSFRVSLLFKPTDRIQNLLIYNRHYAKEHGADSRLIYVNGPAFLASASRLVGAANAATMLTQLQRDNELQLSRDARTTALDGYTFHSRQSNFVVNKTDVDVTNDITIRNIFGYVSFRQYSAADYEGSTVPVLNSRSTAYPNNLDDRRQYSNETQIQAKAFDRKLDLTLGAYFDKSKNGGPTESNSVILGVLRSVAVQTQEARSRAFYGQVALDLSDWAPGLKLNGGLRRTRDWSEGSGASYTALVSTTPDPIPHIQCLTVVSGLQGLIAASPCLFQSSRIDTTTYMYGLDYQLSARTLVYGKVSRGYRPGGFNFVPDGSTAKTYAPEFDLSREIGIKSDWSLGSVDFRTNIAGYYDTKSNIQVRGSVPIGGVAYQAVLNTAKATIKGIEFEGVVQPTPDLTFDIRYAYAESKNDLSSYTTAYLVAACPADPYATAPDATKPCPLSKIARLPKHVVGLNARYGHDMELGGRLSGGVDYEYQSSQFGTDAGALTPDTFKPGYTLVNADLRWANFMDRPVDLSLFVTNLFDKKYLSSAGSVSTRGQIGVGQGAYGAPRMFGGSVRYRF